MKQRNLDLDALEIFVTVAELGSMTRAAQQFGLTQSAVSHVVRHLETSLAAPLFDRTSRPLTLTAIGHRLWHRGNRILAETRQLAAALGGGQSFPELRLGCIDTLAFPFVPRLLQRLREQVSSFTIASGLSSQLRDQFLSRRLDVVLTNDSFDDVDQVDSAHLLTEPFVLVLPPDAPEVPHEAALRHLAQSRPLVRCSAESNLGRLVDRQLRRLGLDAPRVFAFDATDTVIAMVAEGMGWALLPPTALIKSSQHVGRLRVHPFPAARFSRAIHLVSRRGELGGLPDIIQKAARSILRHGYFRDALALWPWLRPMLVN